MSYPRPVFEAAQAVPGLAGPPPPRRMDQLGGLARKAAAAIVPPVVTVAVLLLVWQVAAAASPGGLPPPTDVWRDSRELILKPFYRGEGIDQGLFWQVLTSLRRVALGFSAAAVVGSALGVLVGVNRWAHRGLDPIFQVLRTVPPLAWLPISLAAFHQAQPSALFVIFITSIWPVIINTAVGVRNIPQDYVNVARVLRLSPFEYAFKILLPAVAPFMFTGLRIGIGMSWLAIVASEMLLGGVGIGFFVWDQYNASRIPDIIVALIWVGLVGFALDRAVALAGRLVARGASQS